ncbi:MAG: hypothetical protein KBB91_01665 [Candidatus Pacebacteria bacterium]|nr:hypothetical protein [Candidatus Paceibacterota bacterium]MBP9701093.1 hypothetical protein [Candidatus Paceibacterota bacterium]
MNQIKNIRLNGGKPLNGVLKIAPNKNEALPKIAAALLTKDKMTYIGFPRSPDVLKLLSIMRALGAEVEDGTATITICCRNITTTIVPQKFVEDMQAGYLFAGPLLGILGQATIPVASGCDLGQRGYEGHVEYFKKFGVACTVTDNTITFKLPEYSEEDPTASIRNDDIVERGQLEYPVRSAIFRNPQVTPTENIILLAAKTTKYWTKISGIAQEPHIKQLIELIREMGATVVGEGSTIAILGSNNLKGVVVHLEPDHVDFYGSAVGCIINRTDDVFLETRLTRGIIWTAELLEQLGAKLEIVHGEGVKIFGSRSVFAPDETLAKEKGHNNRRVYIVNPGPWPSHAVDFLPSTVNFASMNMDNKTSTIINNWMYQNGFKYVPILKQMGMSIDWYDNQRVCILGIAEEDRSFSQKLITINSPKVIEGTRAILSYGMARGNYVIYDIDYIFRRNPEFLTNYLNLGADIIEYVPTLFDGGGTS